MKRSLLVVALLAPGVAALAADGELPDGYWPTERTQPILDAAMVVTLDPSLDALTSSERLAVRELLAAGQVMHMLYERQLHHEATQARAMLQTVRASHGDTADVRNLVDLYYLSKGPITTTLDNERLAFLPVSAEVAGKNVYPNDIARDEIDAWIAAHPDAAASILAVRTVVRRATADNLAADLQQLDRFPAVDALHTGLRERLAGTSPDDGLYAIPYALEYAQELAQVRQRLENAADLLDAESPDFAAYLRNRGRDLLSGDYESGNASWVSGDFAGLNLQIGSYETYNDNLLGVKAFFSASLLARDVARSEELQQALGRLQAIEDALPFDHPKRVRDRIPVGVYNIIADFGQARGANTATILPNDADHSRKYGRTILMRANILTNPEIFANRKLRYDAVVSERDRDDLTAEGGFSRTLWHEVGHYLGPGVTADGTDLDTALADTADLFEELKADLISLFAAPALLDAGYHDADTLRAHYADGIRRTLQHVRPRPSQPYQNMQLMQFNFYMEKGLLAVDPDSGSLLVDYARYPSVVAEMLREVLQIQFAGDYDAARDYIARWNYWEEALHEPFARRMQESGAYRRTIVRYAAISSGNPVP